MAKSMRADLVIKPNTSSHQGCRPQNGSPARKGRQPAPDAAADFAAERPSGPSGPIFRTALGLLAVLSVTARPCSAQPAVQTAAEPTTRDARQTQEGSDTGDVVSAQPEVALESRLLSRTRQLTFEGRRAGEGYSSADGQQLVFQSERDSENPFFQIYLMDLSTGDTQRVSPGHGKTTCAWIHPDGTKVLYASTQDDPDAKQKQAAELAKRATGEERRYAWDYDKFYDLYEYDRKTATYQNLTNTEGYDAEASYSPDGKLIVFASNRQAYEADFPATQRQRLEEDPAYFMELYVMNADGSPLADGRPARRLTDVPGYDGGPFFSPNGTNLCWRRFSADGARAEIMTMTLDGTEVKQLTRLGAMSWAPYYHPSGQYLIFATNVHGFANFELYLVDVDGNRAPVRVTSTDGFDGLPVFTPDGKQMVWTSNRGAGKQSQLYIADWNHERALVLLERADDSNSVDLALAAQTAIEAVGATRGDFLPQDILRHVDYLCRPELAGRRTGTQGELLATAYVAAYLDQLGFAPAGDEQSWFQAFEYTSGVSLGADNRLAAGDQSYRVGEDWQPVSFSNTGEFEQAELVFAGYGIAAPEDESQDEYDSFVHLDVAGKWVVAFRFMPEGVSPERRQHLARHSSLRFKAMLARDKGAAGLILVSGPNATVKQQLISMKFDGSLSSSSLPILSVSDAVADEWLQREGTSLKQLQDQLDPGEPMMGVPLPSVKLTAKIDIEQQTRRGRNVLGRLLAGSGPSEQVVIVGAHIDHLGEGTHSSSLARDDDRSRVHWGADDNASGVAAMLEIAQWMSVMKAGGKLPLKRDVLFAAWSGEEDGLIGSSHFAKHWDGRKLPPAESPEVPHHAPTAHGVGAATSDQHRAEQDANHAIDHSAPQQGLAQHGGSTASSSPSIVTDASLTASDSDHSTPQTNVLYPTIAACLNLDMVGRLNKKLILQGIGSSPLWRGEVERRNAPVGLPITLQDDGYIPTDASVFFTRGVPILSAFTGSHEDYHTPRDTPDKLNYEGAARIAKFMALVARSVAAAETAPEFTTQQGPQPEQPRAQMRAYLGTVPDYAESDVKGVKLSAVSKTGPAAKSGVRGGDVIVELAGRKIENIYDYTYAIEALKIGQSTTIVVQRGDESLSLPIVPESRQ